MNRIMKLNPFNLLPEEILDIIMEFYWKDIYTNKVLNELVSPSIICDKIYLYMCRYGIFNIDMGPGNPTDKLHYHYYQIHNNEIKNIISKKQGIFLFSRSNSYECYKNIAYLLNCGVLNNVDERYKYVCAFYLLFSKINHNYDTLKYFEKISNLK